MIKSVKGDLLNFDVGLIVHQVNTLGVMGGGIARQIKDKYPVVYEKYVDFCTLYSDDDLLGCVQFVEVGDVIVANVFAQKSIDFGKCNTVYDALCAGLKRVKEYCYENNIKEIGVPDLIGCGLAGGNRDVVMNIIYDLFYDDEDLILYIVEFKK